MAGNVYSWSTTAATNATADSDINWAEGQTPGSVNNSARAVMAGVAGHLKDNNGTLETAGAANTYTVTSNIAIAALATGLKLRLKINATNTGASTLNLTPAGGAAFGAKSIRSFASGAEAALIGGELIDNHHYIFQYDTAANSAAGGWILLNPSFTGQLAFPATQSASSNANTLDDYEENTFTPAFSFGGGTTGITYSLQQGAYTKIGRLVWFTAEVTLSSNGSSTGNWLVTGLPFTAAATYTPALSVWVDNVDLSADGRGVYATIVANSTTVSLWEQESDVDTTQMTDAWTSDTTYLIVSGCYFV